MSNIKYILLMLSVFAAFSCQREEEDVFDLPAETRMQNAIAGYKSDLTQGTGEWLLNFYPETDHSIGGVAMYLKFTADNNVLVASEVPTNVAAFETSASTWNVISNQSAVLTFDTYNYVWHYFSEPWQADITGRGSDYDYVVTKSVPDSIYLKGIKRNTIMALTKLPSGTNGIDYIKQVAKFADTVAWANHYEFAVNDTTTGYATFSTSSSNSLRVRTVTFQYTLADEAFSVKVGYTFTPTGVIFYEPVEVNGAVFNTLTWNESQKQYSTSNFSMKCTDDSPLKYEDYLGKYSMAYSTAYASANYTAKPLPVEIIADPARPGVGYILKGILTESTPGNICLTYEVGGGLSLKGQHLMDYDNGNILWWLPFSQDNYTSRTTSYGLTATNVKRENDKMVSFALTDDGLWSRKTVGFIIRLYDSAAANLGNVNGVDGQYRYYYPIFTKVD